MEDGALGHALGGEDVEGLVPGLAGVDHQGAVVAVGQGDLGGEDLTLDVAGRVVVVVVEPALAHRPHLGAGQQGLDPVDAVAGLVGVHPGGGPHLGMPGRTVGGGGRVGQVGADVDDPHHPRLGRLGQGRRDRRLVDRPRPTPGAVAEVAVVVDPAHGQADRRGNNGDPFATGSPPG